MLTLMALLRLYIRPLTRRCWVTRSAASVFQLPLPTNQNSRIGRLVRALHLSRVHQDPEKCFLSRGFVPNYVWMFSGSPSRSGCLCTLCIVCPRHSYSSYASSYASANKAIYMLSMFLWSPDATPHTRHPWTFARGNSDNVRSFALALIRHGERCGDATTRNLTPTAASKWRWLGYDDFARKAWGAPQCAHKCIICQPRAHTR